MNLATTPPPVMFLASAALGILVDQMLPGVWFFGWVQVIGVALILGSCAIVPFVLTRFSAAQTPFDVRQKPSGLVTGGPFRYSRNPSYVALTALYLGVALIASSPGMLLIAPLPVFVVNRWVLPLEEQHLLDAFGETYAEYQRQVRRWL